MRTDEINFPAYSLGHTQQQPEFKGLWNGPAWGAVPALAVDRFRPESSDHRPDTQAKLLYDGNGLYGLFRVRDRYVRCIHSRFQDPVYQDSCVEFFFQPDGRDGYFNFEFNCGGALLASYIVDPTRTHDGFRAFTPLSETDVRHVHVYHSQPRIVEPERARETIWYLEYFIPRALIETYAGPVDLKPGTVWRINFYKCADGSSHPHWAAWAEVDALNFHQPHCFGRLRFL